MLAELRCARSDRGRGAREGDRRPGDRKRLLGGRELDFLEVADALDVRAFVIYQDEEALRDKRGRHRYNNQNYQVTVSEIEDLTGTKDHFQAVVVSSSFEGLNRVRQHQAVYRALGDLMSGPVHALALATYTPEKWAAQQSG